MDSLTPYKNFKQPVTKAAQPKEEPNDYANEQYLLGALMLDNRVTFDNLNHKIDVDFFHARQHKLIYNAICRVAESDYNLNPDSVEKELTTSGRSSETGGFAYLVDLMKNATAAGASGALKAVKDAYIERQKTRLGARQDLSLTDLLLKLSELQDLATQDEEPHPTDDIDLISVCPENILAKFSAELAKASKMPRNSVFMTVLSTFSAVASRFKRVAYREGYNFQPLTINVAVEQPPGAAKTRILKAASSPVQAKHRELMKARAVAAAKAKREKSDEALAELQEIETELSESVRFLTDATSEALDQSLESTNGWFAISSSEQAATNTLLGASYSSGAANMDLILKGFNGDWHSSARVTRDGYTGDVVGSMAVVAQSGLISTILAQSKSSGVIERFCLWSEKSVIGHRDHKTEYEESPVVRREYYNLLGEMMKHNQRRNYFDMTDDLHLSGNAWDMINTVRNEYEPMLADGGKYSSMIMRGKLSKFDIYVMKIAGCLHLASRKDTSTIISDRCVEQAIEITRADVNHLFQMLRSSAIRSLSDREELIINCIGSGERTAEFIVTNLHRNKHFRGNNKQGNRGAVRDELRKMVKNGELEVRQSPSKPNETLYKVYKSTK